MSSGEELCDFFRGRGTDIECRTFEQILLWDDVLMEVCHDYIQWLFPTDEPSRFNQDAPILDEATQRVFRTDPDIRKNYRRGAYRFINFLGLSIISAEPDGDVVEIVKAGNFERRFLTCWRGPQNHNWRRMSRVLRSLRLVGMNAELRALTTFLQDFIIEHPGMVDENTISYWYVEGAMGESAGLPMVMMKDHSANLSSCSLASISTAATLDMDGCANLNLQGSAVQDE